MASAISITTTFAPTNLMMRSFPAMTRRKQRERDTTGDGKAVTRQRARPGEARTERERHDDKIYVHLRPRVARLLDSLTSCAVNLLLLRKDRNGNRQICFGSMSGDSDLIQGTPRIDILWANDSFRLRIKCHLCVPRHLHIFYATEVVIGLGYLHCLVILYTIAWILDEYSEISWSLTCSYSKSNRREAATERGVVFVTEALLAQHGKLIKDLTLALQGLECWIMGCKAVT
ncbi:glutamate dehydrogenase [Striga asiatica]|uniref:Glutamate dehydrogenase n=1 Tax=Striga asiatica TaxID=4170 RepID=A0A5A7P9X4_STRAF|nr:glutamate dehydrogenase [Striga asiatica]